MHFIYPSWIKYQAIACSYLKTTVSGSSMLVTGGVRGGEGEPTVAEEGRLSPENVVDVVDETELFGSVQLLLALDVAHTRFA